MPQNMAAGPSFPLRPVVFDLDGTLIDSRQDIAAACNHALERTGRAPLSVEAICAFVGNGAPYLMEHTARVEVGSEELPILLGHVKQYYLNHPTEGTRVLEGAQEALSLPGRQLGLCTNKPRPIMERIIENLGWGARLHAVVAAGDCDEKKPHPEPLHLLARQLDVDPARLVMVGDGPQDVFAGKAVGAHTVGVRGGFLPEQLLREAEPDVVLNSLKELPRYLQTQGL